MRKLLIATLVAALGTTAIAVADPGLPDITPHRHFVQTEKGLVQVGPRVCDDSHLQNAFNQFHSNIHVAVAESPGPEHSAPGLHNSKGADLVARPCSFVAP
jgi:hypothetical protein